MSFCRKDIFASEVSRFFRMEFFAQTTNSVTINDKSDGE